MSDSMETKRNRRKKGLSMTCATGVALPAMPSLQQRVAATRMKRLDFATQIRVAAVDDRSVPYVTFEHDERTQPLIVVVVVLLFLCHS